MSETNELINLSSKIMNKNNLLKRRLRELILDEKLLKEIFHIIDTTCLFCCDQNIEKQTCYCSYVSDYDVD